MTAVATEEQRLLTRSEAAALLRSLRRAVTKVARVCDDDAILFVGALGRCWTAWMTRENGRITAVQYEEGFSAAFGSLSRVSTPHPVPTPDQPESD